MKRIIVSAFMLFISAVSFAQMMPDSTVQFVARWNVGDKYSYWCEEKKYEVYNYHSCDYVYALSGDRTLLCTICWLL